MKKDVFIYQNMFIDQMICETTVDEVLGGTDELLLHFDNIC